MQNGYVEFFNVRTRDELLNESLFIGPVMPVNQRPEHRSQALLTGSAYFARRA